MYFTHTDFPACGSRVRLLLGLQCQFNIVGVVDIRLAQVDADQPAVALLHAPDEVAYGGHGTDRADLQHQRGLDAVQPQVEQCALLAAAIGGSCASEHQDAGPRQRTAAEAARIAIRTWPRPPTGAGSP